MGSSYLLDTDTLIDYSKGREPTCSRIKAMITAGERLGICAINVSEFFAGLPPPNRPIWEEFFASLTYWDIDKDSARIAGLYRYELSRSGQTLTTTDALIAAVALQKHATLLTSNIKHYPIHGLTVYSLRDADTAA
jgi:predicted nucleic acid-binding protein